MGIFVRAQFDKVSQATVCYKPFRFAGKQIPAERKSGYSQGCLLKQLTAMHRQEFVALSYKIPASNFRNKQLRRSRIIILL
jgi:hypothetical protein